MRDAKALLKAVLPQRFLVERRRKARIRIIHISGLFDREWYLETNPDVREAGMDPFDHYLLYGARERRSPGPQFDARWYEHAYPDAAAANEDLLLHYLVFGLKEGRLPIWPDPPAVSVDLDQLPASLRNWAAQYLDDYLERVTPEDLDRVIAECSTVSFDIFDTLLTRIYPAPDDLLRQLESRLDGEFKTSTEFFPRRKAAERELRGELKPGNDVGYDQVYDRLKRGLNEEIVERARQLDFEMECAVLRRREPIVQIFDRSVKAGKRVIVVSDTYFSRSQIEHFLQLNGIEGYHELYISTDTGLRKDTGDVWRFLCEREGADKPGFVHIGDNEHSDYELPNGLGIRTYFLPSALTLYRLSRLAQFTAASFREKIPLAMGPVIAKHFDDPFCAEELITVPDRVRSSTQNAETNI